MVRKRKAGLAAPRRLGEWKNRRDAAYEALRGNGQDFVTIRNADTGEALLVPVPLPGALEELGRAIDGMLGGSGQCVITERPPDHIPLHARVSPDGTIAASCICAGCEAARKCKCPACRAARRFARSAEADRSGEQPASHNTMAESIADATYDLVRDLLPARRPAWTKLAMWLDGARKEELVALPGKNGHVRVCGHVVRLEAIQHWRAQMGDHATPDANRLRLICRQRGK